MKKGILTKLGLLMVASFMVTGCGPKPAPSSEPVSSETSSEPLPPEDEHVDLTYPLEESEINEISDADFRQLTINATGSTSLYEDAKTNMGEYLYDFVRTHNHMTNDEFCQFINAVSQVIELSDDFDGDYHRVYSLLYALAYINADRLYATLNEMFVDGVAWGYIVNLVYGRGFINDYINADRVENGQSAVHNMVEDEMALLAANPYAFNGYNSLRNLEEILTSESGLPLVRFAHRFFRSMIRNLTTEEIGFVLYMTVMSDYFELDMAQDIIEEVSEHLLDCIHHVGAWFLELNVNAATFGKLYPFLNVIYNSVYFGDYDMNGAFFVEKNWYAEAKDALGRLLENANPEGLRVLFQFVGMLATNISQEQLDMFFVESWDDFDGQIIVDLYNEQYGLLTGEEKAAFKEFFAAFGVDFDAFIEALKEAALDPQGGRALTRESDDSENVFSQIVAEYLSAPIVENFDFGEPDYYCKYREGEYVLIIKEGTNFTIGNFEDYLHSGNTPKIGIQRELIEDRRITRGDEIGDYIYEDYDEDGNFSFRELVDMEGFDTTSCGLKETSFTLKTKVAVWAEGGYVYYPIQPTLTMNYMVVPSTLNEIHGMDHDVELNYGDDYYIESRAMHEDSNGNPYYYDYQTVYLLKDAHYAANDVYVNVDWAEDGKLFDASLNRFVPIDQVNRVVRSQSEKVYLNTLDTSRLGTRFAVTSMNYYQAPDWSTEPTFLTSEKVCIRYVVVESMDQLPGADISTPVK